MIRSFEIRNFKAFKDITLQLGQLVLLSGVNSSGKSSVLQALRLAELAMSHGSTVQLNQLMGLELGEATDVLNREALVQHIELAVHTEGGVDRLRLIAPDDQDRSVALEVLPLGPGREESRRWQVDTYLGAERVGPRDILEVAPSGGTRVDVGVRGEFAAHMLALFDRRRVPDALLHPSTAEIPLAPTLRSQSEAWLSSIVHPTRIRSTWLPQASAAALQFRDLDVMADWVRPANVGFGLTYCLPIIVAALGSTPGAVFIVENPEAHLHPRAQSEVGKFLVRLAASGVQTIVETHSDHVLNGVRIAVAAEQLLSTDDVAIHFFGASGEGVTEITLDDNGGLSVWPPGFFDQAVEDLATVSRVRHGG
jgi:predicted ATPase